MQATKDLFYFSGIIFPILMSLALLAQTIYGKEIYEFSNFALSFNSIFLMVLGNINMNMINVEPILTLFFFFIFYANIVYFLFTFVMGLYIDNYRRILLDFGYIDTSNKSWGIKSNCNF